MTGCALYSISPEGCFSREAGACTVSCDMLHQCLSTALHVLSRLADAAELLRSGGHFEAGGTMGYLMLDGHF